MERNRIDRVNRQMTNRGNSPTYERPRDNYLIFRELLEMKGKEAKCFVVKLTKDTSRQITGKESQIDGKHVKS